MTEETPDQTGAPEFRGLLDYLEQELPRVRDGAPEAQPCEDCGERHRDDESELQYEDALQALQSLVGNEFADSVRRMLEDNRAHWQAMEGVLERMRAAAEATNLELSADDQLRWVITRAGCTCLLPMVRLPDGRWATTEQEVAQALSAEQAAAIAADLEAAQEAMLAVARALAQNEKD